MTGKGLKVILILVVTLVNVSKSISGSSQAQQQIRLGQFEEKDDSVERFWRKVVCLVRHYNEKLAKSHQGTENLLTESHDRCFTNGINDSLERTTEDLVKRRQNEAKLHLLCRSYESITVIIESDNDQSSPPPLYLTKLEPNFEFYMSTSNMTTIAELLPDTDYQVTSYLLINKIDWSSIEAIETATVNIKTLPLHFTPGPIPSASVSKSSMRLNQHEKLDAEIIWEPVEDLVCVYDIVCNSRGIIHDRFNLRNERRFSRPLVHSLRNLSFGLVHQVRLYALNEHDHIREGPVYNFTFQTPPAKDFNLTGDDDHRDHHTHHSHLPIIITEYNWAVVLAFSGIVVVIFLIVIAVNYKRIKSIYNRRERRRLFHNIPQDALEMQTFTDLTIYLDNEREVGLDNLKLHEVIGQGAFGLVRKAVITINSKEETVAVKLLRKHANEEDLREFNHEIGVMKAVGQHPNIIGLVGHSKVIDCRQQMMILIEYCNKGNLLNYLRDEWKRLTQLANEAKHSATVGISQAASSSSSFGNAIDNPCYSRCDGLTNRDLLSIAGQIANGMDYLFMNKVVHRDLAARNILVCDDNLVKISDFGMSRDVYQYNIYKKKGSGKLPVKWLAIESLTHQVYTSQSDVWSFGILLYEILTLGSDPYPGIPTFDMLKLLNTGYRMDRPRNCPEMIYSQMLDCWRTIPAERPSFKQMHEEFKRILEELTDDMATIQLEISEKSDYPSYLKPIF